MECGQRSRVKTLLLQRCALHKFHVTNDQNARDQITRVIKLRSVKSYYGSWFCALHVLFAVVWEKLIDTRDEHARVCLKFIVNGYEENCG